MFKNFLRSGGILLVGFGMLLSLSVFAQPPPGDPGDDPDIPIDGGISLLIAAGALYGSKKIYDARRKK